MFCNLFMWRSSSGLHPQSRTPHLSHIYEALCSGLLCCCSFPVLWEMPEASEGEITEQFCFHWHCRCASNTSRPKYNPLQTAEKGCWGWDRRKVKEIYIYSQFRLKTGPGENSRWHPVKQKHCCACCVMAAASVCYLGKLWWWRSFCNLTRALILLSEVH